MARGQTGLQERMGRLGILSVEHWIKVNIKKTIWYGVRWRICRDMRKEDVRRLGSFEVWTWNIWKLVESIFYFQNQLNQARPMHKGPQQSQEHLRFMSNYSFKEDNLYRCIPSGGNRLNHPPDSLIGGYNYYITGHQHQFINLCAIVWI